MYMYMYSLLYMPSGLDVLIHHCLPVELHMYKKVIIRKYCLVNLCVRLAERLVTVVHVHVCVRLLQCTMYSVYRVSSKEIELCEFTFRL